VGKLVLERSTRPLGEREVHVASGEASVGGDTYQILARAPMHRIMARRIRNEIRRHRRGNRDGSRGRGRGRGQGGGGGGTDPDTGSADSVDSGF
jgi:hypothetical protein